MSHLWLGDDKEAPTPGEARRRGEQDFENGRGSYEDPYRERAREAFDDHEWRRASRAWEEGHHAARCEEEERAAEAEREADERDRRQQEEREIEEAHQIEAERAYADEMERGRWEEEHNGDEPE